jgi:zinc protease
MAKGERPGGGTMKRVLATLLLITTPALGADFKDAAKTIETRTLKNGMKVVVWPDRDIPNAAMYIWYKVGSRNERPGITGLAHFFEHMMFNGAKKYGSGEFDRVMEANGGANNAFTSNDVTVYQNWFPVTATELIFDLEADRIQNLAFDPKIIESERGVVYSERRSSVDNNNPGQLYEQVSASAFIAHPYQFPTIGWPSDIESWTHEDLTSFFRTYYAPNNAAMVVVGDVAPAQVFALAEKYIAPIPAQKPPDPIRTKEPEQLGERRVMIRKEAQTPLLQFAYHIGSATDPDRMAVELLMAILSNGQSSRLHRSLVEDAQAAIDVSAFQENGFDPSLATFFVTLPAGGDLAKAEQLFNRDIDRVISEGVTDAELRKAKNMKLAEFWDAMKTINGKARALGEYETFFGDYRKLFDAPDAYEKVTRDDVKRVAAKYLRISNRTVGVLEPQAAAVATTAETTR